MLLNAKLNDTAQKFIRAETVHMRKIVRNSMETTGSTKRPFKIFYGEKLKIIGSFSEFGCIAYIMKRGNNKKQIKGKTYKPIML